MGDIKVMAAKAGSGFRIPIPGVHRVQVVPDSPVHSMGRLRGTLFDTNKNFLLPTGIEELEGFRSLLEAADPCHVLIVGHADTSGGPSVNDALSRERALAVKQYLEDDVPGWLKNYAAAGAKRWGAREDRLMIAGIADGETRRNRKAGAADPVVKAGPQGAVLWFQQRHNAAVDAGSKSRPKLAEDGQAGPKTREEIVRDYMAQDGPSWMQGKIKPAAIAIHGSGENFPLDQTGLELDDRLVAERNGEKDRIDRRVELFFFDAASGPTPPPAAPDGPEYLAWRKAAVENRDPSIAGIRNRLIQLELEDALFRTDSAVVMPEGEAPAGADGSPRDRNGIPDSALNSVGAFARVLRFNAANPGRSILIAGHTDTEGGEKDNLKLSQERAEAAHAMLMGERDRFAALADKRHKVGDYKQILRWVSIALADVPAPPGSPPPAASFAECDPGAIDDVAATGEAPLKAFQRAYNANKKGIGAEGPDLAVDGRIGPKTWGAFFDCYEFSIRDELGADAAGVADLRAKIAFLPTDKPFVGFGESHPIDGIGRDGFRSQANRRVELLIFEAGEEPDLALLQEAPDKTELYLPGAYVRTPFELDVPVSDRIIEPLRIFLLDEDRKRMGADPDSEKAEERDAGAPYRMEFPDGEIRQGYAKVDGVVEEHEVPDFDSCLILWGRNPDSQEPFPPTGKAEADAYFVFRNRISLHGPPGKSRILEALGNMGHRGDEAARRAEFEAFYKSRTDALINQVHQTGKPAQ